MASSDEEGAQNQQAERLEDQFVEERSELERRRSRVDQDMDRLRDAAKWAIGLFAAPVGVLLAGAGIGSAGADRVSDLLLVGAAVFGMVAAVVFVVVRLTPIMAPSDWTMREIIADKKMSRAIHEWFRDNPRFLTYLDRDSAETFQDLHHLEAELNRRWEAARDDPAMKWSEYERLSISYNMTLRHARYLALRWMFRRRLMFDVSGAAVLVAASICALVVGLTPDEPSFKVILELR